MKTVSDPNGKQKSGNFCAKPPVAPKAKRAPRQKLPSTISVPLLIHESVSLTNFILATFQHPANWPLSDVDRIHFVRAVYVKALKISELKEFREVELQIAANRFAKSVL